MAETRSPDPDLLFARYQRNGDPELLAQVFDRTAPRLLRVAIHLAGDPAEAEDLVQATFVTAIEKARIYQPGRPVLPWLTGILEKHAQALRAKARRRIEPERLPARPPSPRPDQSAEGVELDDAVANALDRIPDPYRPALVLKLRHGLKPAQIADALGRSPGAVRVQLHRGMEMLRQCLPMGIAMGAVFSLTPTRGLAAMRKELWRHAVAQGSVLAQAIWIGGMIVKKSSTAVAAIALALTTGAGLYWLDGAEPAPLDPGADLKSAAMEQPRDPAAGEAATVAAQMQDGDAGLQRNEQADTVLAAGSGGILVRTLWKDDRSPAEGVGVRVLPHDGRHPDLHSRRRVSSGEGNSLFRTLEPGQYGIYIDREAILASEAELENDAEDPVQINLAAGETITLERDVESMRILEAVAAANSFQEQPVVVGSIQRPGPPPPPAKFSYRLDQELQAIREVRGVLEAPRMPEELDLEALADMLSDLHASSSLPNQEAVAIEQVDDEVVVVEVLVPRGRTVAGMVYDPTGAPVPDAEIWVRGKNRSRGQPVTKSDETGAFSVTGLERNARIWAAAPGFQPSPRYRVRKEKNDLELRFTDAARSLTARVVDPRGEPIEGASVRFGDPDGSEHQPIRLRSDRNGQVSSDVLRPMRTPVTVLAPGYQPYRDLLDLAQLPDGSEPEFRLDPGWISHGKILDSEGNPVPNTTVYAEAEDRPTTEVTSGADGTYRLECLPPGPVTLRVDEGDHRAMRLPIHGTTGDDQEHDLVLPPWGRISGRIVDEEGRPLNNWVLAATPLFDGEIVKRRATSDKEGRFEIETEPELKYRLEAYPAAKQSFTVYGGDGNVRSAAVFMEVIEDSSAKPRGRRTIPLPQFGDVPGMRDNLEVVIPMDQIPSAAIRGVITDAAGQPLRARILVHVDGGSRRVNAKKDGSFEIDELIPGPYSFQVVSRNQEFPSFYLDVDALDADQKLDLGTINPPAGGSLHVTCEDQRAQPGRLRARILDGQDREIAKLQSVGPMGHTIPLAAGDFTVQLLDGEDVVTSRSVRVRAGEAQRLPITLR